MNEVERDGRRLLTADLSLAPLGAGDYFLEVTAGAADQSGQSLFVFRIR
jgi:hypothetical protein